MRKATFNIIVIAAVSFALPALAQQPSPPLAGVVPGAEMTPERLSAYLGWSEEQRTQYDAWPVDTQVYYWTLSPPRQEVFWRISDSDKLALTAMSEPDRAAAWDLVEQKMLSDDPATMGSVDEAVDPATPAGEPDEAMEDGLPDD
ncbi:hypothetical protein OAS19_04005 [Altererythrobacter sp.]|nr:hypothetical protein [Altererythrobacter sp.]